MSGTPRVERHASADRFLAAAQGWLLERAAENNRLLGIALKLRGREPTDPPPYWASVHGTDDVAGCACRAPPQPLVLSRMPASAVAGLADDVGAVYASLCGVSGPAQEAEAFAAAWTQRKGGTWTRLMQLRLHELTRVVAPRATPAGSLRQALAADAPLAREWIDAYVRDTGLHPAPPDTAERLIGRGQLYVWIDRGEPRAMAATSHVTLFGCSINTVYTPPPYRRRGYATAAVAALSRLLLEGGLEFCCLYTDATNPTSNSIYAKIGYAPIRDDVEIAIDSDE